MFQALPLNQDKPLRLPVVYALVVSVSEDRPDLGLLFHRA
jgi:hypothetical protein